MNTSRVCIFLTWVAAWPCIAFAGLFGPSNFDECVLENMKGVGSDMAARAVVAACSRKFPSAAPKPAPTVKAAEPLTWCPRYEDIIHAKDLQSALQAAPDIGCVPRSKEEQRKLKAYGFTEFTPIPDDGK